MVVLRSATSAWALTSTTVSLTLASTSTHMARDAKSSVHSVSPWFSRAGLTQTSRDVLQLPPSEPSSSRVSLLSLVGTCFFLAARALTTLPSASRLLLMAAAS